jgi:hypothetical protein
MHRFAPALALLGSIAVPALHAETLETRTYTVEITPLCGERVTDCEQFAYADTHKRTGSHLNMVGKPGQRPCPPGNAPCDPLGWQFHDGNTSYFVGQDGWLIVTQGNKTILREQGAWRER